MEKQQRHKRRSDQEWFDLITKCRQSGLSDTQWCYVNGINRSSFCMAAKRLQEKSYALPEPSEDKDALNIPVQEVVPVTITPDPIPMRPAYSKRTEPADMYLDNSHTIEIKIDNISIRIANDAEPALVRFLLQTIGGL